MSKNRLLFLVALVLVLVSGCLTIDNTFSGLPPGPWRGVLKLENIPVMPNPRGEPLPEKVNYQFDEVTGGELPFLFKVVYDDRENFHIELINGEETIRLDNITMALDRSTAKDTILIGLGQEGGLLSGIFEENIIEGSWTPSKKGQISVPFVARHGRDYLFTTLRKEPATDLSGRWEASLGIELEEPEPAILELRQSGNDLRATLTSARATITNLTGTVQADKLYLSYFNGDYAYLLEAQVEADGTLLGSMHSGPRSKIIWKAVRNSDAKRPMGDPQQ